MFIDLPKESTYAYDSSDYLARFSGFSEELSPVCFEPQPELDNRSEMAYNNPSTGEIFNDLPEVGAL